MAGAMLHRGPDEVGIYRDSRAGFAHTRLSIIDLAAGQQPMTNEDGTLWVVFNGEIFNYVELREELLALGHQLRTHSDTEVILHAYESWGEDAFARFNGQFAIALWDEKSRELLLARDRLGVRPVYIAEERGRLFFASEVKAIFAANPELPREPDPLGLAETFTFWAVLPPRSVFRGITELRPATLRRYSEDRTPVERRYWTQPFPLSGVGALAGSIEEATVAVRGALERATSLRMLRADVPVGSYLSGGLDSSLIAALGRRAKGEGFQTFSIRFTSMEHDETDFQRQMVERLGTDHHEILVGENDIAAAFPDVVWFAERPLLRTAAAPLFLLSRLVRENGIKVVLTGEGADEMFAGYDLFREGKVRRAWARHPNSRCRPRLLDRLYPYLERSPTAQRAIARQFFGRDLDRAAEPGFAHRTRWQTTSALSRLFTTELGQALAPHDVVRELLSDLPDEFPRWDSLAQDQYLESRTLLSGYLLCSQGDRMLMAHSVEGRFPFLDREVVDLASRLPSRAKLRVLDEKHVLKRVAKDLVPEEIVRRKKQPYRAPDGACFVRRGAPDWVFEVTSERALSEVGVFDGHAVSALLSKCRKQPDPEKLSNADNMAIVGVLSTQLLFRTFRNLPAPKTTFQIRTLVER